MKRIMFFVFFLMTMLASNLLAAEQTVGLDKIVAVVNEGIITQSQLAEQIKITTQQLEASHAPMPDPSVLRKKVLDDLINTELQTQIAKKAGVQVTDAMVDEAINRIAQQNGITPAEFKGKVEETGLTYDAYRKEIRKQILLSQVQQRAVSPQVKVSDQEVTDFLMSHGKDLSDTNANNTSYQVTTLLIPLPDSPTPEQIQSAKQTANDAIKQLRQGTSFDDLVNSKLGLDNNIQQNDLGSRKLTQLPDLYVAAIRSLRIGGIAGPIQAANGFHIVKLVAVQADAGDSAASSLSTTETHVRHIIIKTSPVQPDAQVKRRLEELRASILGGLDFSKAAMDNSQDPGSAGKGGDLGWMSQGALDPAFEAIMNKSPVGVISQPFKSQFGWHILEVLGRRPIKDSLALRKQKAKEIIFQRKFNEQLQNWLVSLRNIQYVKVLD